MLRRSRPASLAETLRRSEEDERWGRSRVAVLIPLAVILIAVVLIGVFAAVLLLRTPATLKASSTASGTDVTRLLAVGLDSRGTTWQSSGEAVGATLTYALPRPAVIDRIRFRSPSTSSIRSVVADFGDGSSLLLTADPRGDVDVSFPGRRVDDLRLVVASTKEGVSNVALSSLRVDASGTTDRSAAASLVRRQVASASSTGAGSTVGALVDAGSNDTRVTGNDWIAGTGDARPWVQLTWPTATQLTSVQLFGPRRTARAPAAGTLRFSDGSTLTVGEVRGGGAPPTTIGFAPRMVTSVRFQMASAGVGLGEFKVFAVGTTPAAVATTSGADLTAAPARSCSTAAAPTRSPSALRLVCPATGSSIDGRFSIAIAGPAGRDVSLEVFQPFPGGSDAVAGALQVLQTTRTDASGLARFSVDGSRLPGGPVNLAVRLTGQVRPLVVQVINTAVAPEPAKAAGPPGRTLLWQDEFTGKLSASVSGADTLYAAAKPELRGSAQFGDAVFADPSWRSDNLGTVGGGYLRLRLSPKGRQPEIAKDRRTQIGALISSAAVGGGGTSAQYGYFEARILGAPGLGTWPAFWMLSNSTLVSPSAASGEVDAVELYGTDTSKACHAVHSYSVEKSTIRCLPLESRSDWSLQWHTYGVDIGPGSTRFFVDGRLVTTESGPSNADDAYFFLLNLASGGGWPIDLSATNGLSDMYVDWVRVYT